MAGRRKATKSTAKRSTSKQATVARKESPRSGGIMEYLRISESYTSLILGIVVVIIASVLLISFIKGNQFGQTPPPAPEISATKIEPLVSPTAAEMAQSEAVTPIPEMMQSIGKGTYTVQPGDDLWHIAEKVYNDGYKWTLIAKANNITDPGTIFAGNVLKTPSVSTIDETKGGQTAQSQQAQMPGQQPAIAGSSYKVEHGDTLWGIAERRYNDGYRWVDIAKANNLSDPNLIHADNTLTLPQ